MKLINIFSPGPCLWREPPSDIVFSDCERRISAETQHTGGPEQHRETTHINRTLGHFNDWAASWQNQQSGMCTQRRLRSAWASAQSDQSLLSTWRKLGSLATHWAHSEGSDQTERMPRLIWVFAGRTVILLVLSWGGSNIVRLCEYTEWVTSHWTEYCKIQNIWTPKNCCNYPKIGAVGFYYTLMHPKDADLMANSIDPDQTLTSVPCQHCLTRTVCPNIYDYIIILRHESCWKES